MHDYAFRLFHHLQVACLFLNCSNLTARDVTVIRPTDSTTVGWDVYQVKMPAGIDEMFARVHDGGEDSVWYKNKSESVLVLFMYGSQLMPI